MEITVLNSQSFFDIAIQHTGDVMNAFAIAKANEKSLTAFLAPGTVLNIPNDIEKNQDVVNYYAARKVQPATGSNEDTLGGVEQLEGISYWIINKNFKVS